MIKDIKLTYILAHAADYVWRSCGTIAKYVENGANVTVVVMTFGVRGESNHLSKEQIKHMTPLKKFGKKKPQMLLKS